MGREVRASLEASRSLRGEEDRGRPQGLRPAVGVERRLHVARLGIYPGQEQRRPVVGWLASDGAVEIHAGGAETAHGLLDERALNVRGGGPWFCVDRVACLGEGWLKLAAVEEPLAGARARGGDESRELQ